MTSGGVESILRCVSNPVQASNNMSNGRTLIESGWSFTQTSSTNIKVDKEDWHQCASFPTSVQAELTKSGKIPHFHKGLNEWETQCKYSIFVGRHMVGIMLILLLRRDRRGRLAVPDQVRGHARAT